jgi:regulator of RNase E activity RraA
VAPHAEGMINLKITKGGITIGNGEVMVAKKKGYIPCELCDKYGNALNKGQRAGGLRGCGFWGELGPRRDR